MTNIDRAVRAIGHYHTADMKRGRQLVGTVLYLSDKRTPADARAMLVQHGIQGRPVVVGSTYAPERRTQCVLVYSDAEIKRRTQ